MMILPQQVLFLVPLKIIENPSNHTRIHHNLSPKIIRNPSYSTRNPHDNNLHARKLDLQYHLCQFPIQTTLTDQVQKQEGSLEELEGKNDKYKKKIEEMLEENSMQQVDLFKIKIADKISKGKGEVEVVIHMGSQMVQSFNLKDILVQIGTSL
jgi:hypothetical protein